MISKNPEAPSIPVSGHFLTKIKPHMKKIQVTTVRINSDAQVILPNTYFITKAVKAMLESDALNEHFRELEKEGQDIDPEILNALDTINTFLHELIDALEGKESE